MTMNGFRPDQAVSVKIAGLGTYGSGPQDPKFIVHPSVDHFAVAAKEKARHEVLTELIEKIFGSQVTSVQVVEKLKALMDASGMSIGTPYVKPAYDWKRQPSGLQPPGTLPPSSQGAQRPFAPQPEQPAQPTSPESPLSSAQRLEIDLLKSELETLRRLTDTVSAKISMLEKGHQS